MQDPAILPTSEKIKDGRIFGGTAAEHKPGTGTRSNNKSLIKQHTETTNHDIYPNYIGILERNIHIRQERLFLAALP